MSHESEARAGLHGDGAYERAAEAAERIAAVVPAALPMNAEQWAHTHATTNLGCWRALAWWLRERSHAGRDRFSPRDVPLEALGASPERLVELGLLRRHLYPSGAWQFAITPWTRSWWMAVITTPVPADTADAVKES